MLLFPNAKINLGLHILRKRTDGFHDIETCMYPIPWQDALEIVPAERFSFRCTGLPVAGDSTNNLVVKAYELLRDRHALAPVTIHLHKAIPMGAGLGGGSADAAFALQMLNAVGELHLSPQQLKQYAAQLGSDCAFFIDNVPSICTGRGEILSPIDFTLSGLYLLLVTPQVHVSTADAYAGVTPHDSRPSLREIILHPTDLQERLVNDFEVSIFAQHPLLAQIKQQLYAQGALYAAMSGSGSTMFGLFDSPPDTVIYVPHATKVLAL